MRKPLFIISLLLAMALLITACGQPTPAPISEPPQEEQPAAPAPETQPTEAQAPAPVQPTDAPPPAEEPAAPTQEAAPPDTSTPYQYNSTSLPASFNEAPSLAEQVRAGTLPPVEQRLPKNPPVVVPFEEIGRYGGNIRSNVLDISHWWLLARQLAHSDLVRMQGGNSGVFEPDLAERWEVSDDAQVWTFYLREGIKWSDGEPFTTADLMFWYENVLKNADLMPTKPAWLSSGDDVVDMEAIDELTIRLTFGDPRPLFLLDLTQGNSHEWPKWTNHPAHYMEQFHPNFVSEADLDAKIRQAGVGSWVDLYRRETEPHTVSPGRPYLWPWTPDGPMGADGRWSFSRNPYYYKIDEAGNQLPYVDSWSVTLVPETQGMILSTIAGEFELVHTYIRGDSLPTIWDAINRGAPIRVIENLNAKTGEVALYINYTVDDPVLREIFNDVRFRQAVSLGINREEMSEARFRGFSTPGQASFPPIDPYVYNQEWFESFIEYDPDRANQLLDEMGLTERDSSGFRLRPDGQRLSITMDFQTGNHAAAIELLPEHMRELGIDLQVVPSAPTLLIERTQSNSVQWSGWSMQPSFYSPWALLPGSHLAAPNRPFGVLWALWYTTGGAQGEEPPADMKRVMELVDETAEAQSIEERAALIREAGELHAKNLWVIGIAGMDLRPHIVHSDLRNVPPAPYGLNTDPAAHSMYSEQWYFDR